MSLKDYKVYPMCANTQNLVHENLVYFQDLNGLAARWIFSPTRIQFLVKCRNPVCDIFWLMIPNLVESSLMGKIQDQSVSTYVLDSLFVSLSVLTYLAVCLYSHQQLTFSESCLLVMIAKISYQISWSMTGVWCSCIQSQVSFCHNRPAKCSRISSQAYHLRPSLHSSSQSWQERVRIKSSCSNC